MKNNMFKNLFLWFIIAIILVAVFSNFNDQKSSKQKVTYSYFVSSVNSGKIKEASIEGKEISAVTVSGAHLTTYIPTQDPSLLQTLIKKGVNVQGIPPKKQSIF